MNNNAIKVIIRKWLTLVSNPTELRIHTNYYLQRLFVKKVRINDRCFYQYFNVLYPEYLNKGNACSFIEQKARQYCTGHGLDIGAGAWVLPGAISIQNDANENAYLLNRFPAESLDFIFSSHCLEHLEFWKQAINLWAQKLKSGGILFLYLPHESMKLWNPGGLWVGNLHKWKPSTRILLPYLTSCGFNLFEYNPYRDEYWSFHIVAKKR